MAYEGELLTYCPKGMFNFMVTYAVVVTGAKLNPYGHMLLNTGGKGGMYFHVTDLDGRPHFMNEAQFQRYLRETNKTIVTVIRLNIPEPYKCQAKLEEIMSQSWLWGGVVHNCETMVQEVVEAGGGRRLQTGLFPLPMQADNMCESW